MSAEVNQDQSVNFTPGVPHPALKHAPALLHCALQIRGTATGVTTIAPAIGTVRLRLDKTPPSLIYWTHLSLSS